MVNDKNLGVKSEGVGSDVGGGSAPRARNRTVMLTPEVTGEVRARLARDQQDPLGRPPPVASAETGRSTARFQGGTYTPSGAAREGEQERISSQSTQPGVAVSSTQARQVTQAAPGKGDRMVWNKDGRVLGFLVSYDRDPHGQVFDLRCGRLIVTSEAATSGNYLILTDESVSPMHAILRMDQGGEIQVLDQLSEYGTTIVRAGSKAEQRLVGEKSTLAHGDVIHFGKRKFHVCMIAVDD